MKNKPDSSQKRTSKKDKQKEFDKTDITDSKKDQEKLQGDEATIDIPEVKDIPAVINVDPAILEDPSATATVASADEEGEGVLDKLNTEEEEDDENLITMGTEADVTNEELETLEKTDYLPTKDEEQLERGTMDSTDDDGDPLNEKSFSGNSRGGDRSGSDLDIPGSEEDDADEAIGEEDEENNPYSLGADKEDFNEADKS